MPTVIAPIARDGCEANHTGCAIGGRGFANVQAGGFESVSIRPPRRESYGALSTHLIDPEGVLLHFAQMDTR